MANTESAADDVVELSIEEFNVRWRKHYDAIFSGRDLDKGPFRDPTWRCFSIGAPAYFSNTYPKPLSAVQRKHIELYDAIGDCAAQIGDADAVGVLRDGPHLNTSIFYTGSVTAKSITKMRRSAVDGFDMHVFSASKRWGLAILWDEEVAVIAGDAAWEQLLLTAVGGECELKNDFDAFSSYLLTLSTGSKEMVERLRIQAGWSG